MASKSRTSAWQEKQRAVTQLAYQTGVNDIRIRLHDSGTTLTATSTALDGSAVSYGQGLEGVANKLQMSVADFMKMIPHVIRSSTPPEWAGHVERYTKDHTSVIVGRIRADGSRVMVGDYVLYQGLDENIDSGSVRWIKNTKHYDRIRKQWISDLEHGLIPVQNGQFLFDHSVLVTDWHAYVHAVLSGDLYIVLNCADTMSRSDQFLAKGTSLLNADTRKANTAMHLVLAAVSAQGAYDKIDRARSDLIATNRDIPESLVKRHAKALQDAKDAHGAFTAFWSDLHLVTIDQSDLSLAVSSVVAGDTVAAQRAAHDATVKRMVDARGYTVKKLPSTSTATSTPESDVQTAPAQRPAQRPARPSAMDATIAAELKATRARVKAEKAAAAAAAAKKQV